MLLERNLAFGGIHPREAFLSVLRREEMSWALSLQHPLRFMILFHRQNWKVRFLLVTLGQDIHMENKYLSSPGF